jgi:uncharacterized iron-regulated membrane protein
MAASRFRLRRVWLQVHLWTALVLGLFAALIGLTGAALTLTTPLARWEQGAGVLPAYTRAAERPIDPGAVDGWIAATRARYPDIDHIEAVAGPGAAPLRTAAPLLVAHGPMRLGEETHLVIPIDAETGQPRGRFVLEEGLVGTLFAIHTRLLLPLKGGLEAASIIGIAVLLSAATGLYLWWPKQGWRAALTWPRGARGRRAWLAAHNLIGVYGLVVLVAVCFSGVWLAKPGWIDPALAPLAPVRGPAMIAPPAPCAVPATPGTIAAAAVAHLPGGALGLAVFPDEPGKPAAARIRRAHDVNQRFGNTQLLIDPRCGRVLGIVDSAGFNAGEWLKAWMHPVHADLGLGWPGAILVALAGLSLPVLWVSGLVLWLRRRAADRALAARRRAATA